MSLAGFIVLLVAIQRLAELIYSRRNTARLMARGAREYGAAHYPLVVTLHAAWLVSIFVAAADATLNLWLIAVFVAIQAARIWILATLREHWTTRVIVLPGAPLVRRGAYRYLDHPNYLVVTVEIAVLPLAFGLWQLAVVFSILNAAILTFRIRVENAALAQNNSPT